MTTIYEFCISTVIKEKSRFFAIILPKSFPNRPFVGGDVIQQGEVILEEIADWGTRVVHVNVTKRYQPLRGPGERR
jgi:hypothetical protein